MSGHAFVTSLHHLSVSKKWMELSWNEGGPSLNVPVAANPCTGSYVDAVVKRRYGSAYRLAHQRDCPGSLMSYSALLLASA